MASLEGEAPTKQYITVVEKKVRNLEKRKAKLDSYKIKASEGTVLDKDQKEAVSKYDQVIQSLEFSKELLKQFQQINSDNEKLLRKQAKREKIEKQNSEISRLKDVLKVQVALKTVGDEVAREGFTSGKCSVNALSEEQLNVLDDFQNLLNLSTDAEQGCSQQCGTAAEHMYLLLEKSEKNAVGEITYKEVAQLLDDIIGGSYFEAGLQEENNESKDDAELDPSSELLDDVQLSNGDNAPSESDCLNTNGFEVNDDADEEEQTHLPDLSEASVVENGASYQNSLEGMHNQLGMVRPVSDFQSDDVLLHSSAVPQGVIMSGHWPNSESLIQPQLVNRAPFAAPLTAQYFGSSAFEGQRPVREIVSSMQGNYNFLQESLIENEKQINVNNSSIVNAPVDVVASSASPSSLQQHMIEHHHLQQEQHLPMATIAGSQAGNFAAVYHNRLHHHLLHHHDGQTMGMPTSVPGDMYFQQQQQQQQQLYHRVPPNVFDMSNQAQIIPEVMESKQIPSISTPSSIAYPPFHSMQMPGGPESEGRGLQPFMMGVPTPSDYQEQSQQQSDKGPYTMNPNADIFHSGFHASNQADDNMSGDVQNEQPQNGSPGHVDESKEVGAKTFAQTASSGKSYQEFTNTQIQRGPKAGSQYQRYPNRQQFPSRQGSQPPYNNNNNNNNNSNTNNPPRPGNAPFRGGTKFGPGGARPSSQGSTFYQRNEHYHS